MRYRSWDRHNVAVFSSPLARSRCAHTDSSAGAVPVPAGSVIFEPATSFSSFFEVAAGSLSSPHASRGEDTGTPARSRRNQRGDIRTHGTSCRNAGRPDSPQNIPSSFPPPLAYTLRSRKASHGWLRWLLEKKLVGLLGLHRGGQDLSCAAAAATEKEIRLPPRQWHGIPDFAPASTLGADGFFFFHFFPFYS